MRAQEAIVSDLDKALGQHILEEAADARFGGKRPVFPCLASALLEAARDMPVFELFKAVIGKSHPADVGCEVDDDLGTGAGRFTMRHPCLLPDVGRHLIEQTGVDQGRLELPTEDVGARADGNKPASRAGREPLRALRRQGPTGHEIMEMRMRGHIPGPCVQDPNQADLSAEVLGVHGQCLQGSSGGLEEQVVQEGLVRAGHGAQFRGQRQGHQEIGDRQEWLTWLF